MSLLEFEMDYSRRLAWHFLDHAIIARAVDTLGVLLGRFDDPVEHTIAL